jgi:hypothetical protein
MTVQVVYASEVPVEPHETLAGQQQGSAPGILVLVEGVEVESALDDDLRNAEADAAAGQERLDAALAAGDVLAAIEAGRLLADALQRARQWARSLRVQRENLERLHGALGPGHLETLHAGATLALALLLSGEAEEGRALLSEVERQPFEEQPDVATSLLLGLYRRLAAAYALLGQRGDARRHLEQGWSLFLARDARLELSPCDLLSLCDELITVMLGCGDIEAALACLQQLQAVALQCFDSAAQALGAALDIRQQWLLSHLAGPRFIGV